GVRGRRELLWVGGGARLWRGSAYRRIIQRGGFGGRGPPPPMKLVVLIAGLTASLLGACSLVESPGLSQSTVIAAAAPGDEIAYDVVKVDDAVVQTLAGQTAEPFHGRFKKYTPP